MEPCSMEHIEVTDKVKVGMKVYFQVAGARNTEPLQGYLFQCFCSPVLLF